jgi:hypothetical protein
MRPTNTSTAYIDLAAATMSDELAEDIELERKLLLVRSSDRYTGARGDARSTNILVYNQKTGGFPNCETGNYAGERAPSTPLHRTPPCGNVRAD